MIEAVSSSRDVQVFLTKVLEQRVSILTLLLYVHASSLLMCSEKLAQRVNSLDTLTGPLTSIRTL